MSHEPTDRIREAWERQAESWHRQRDALRQASLPIHRWLVDHLQPQAGQRVLELGAGPGDTGFLAAECLGRGRLVSTDIAASMVDVARRRGAELGITNADYRVLDAQAMDLEDSSFDGIICRWALMLMPDPAAALRECRRVLVPGGRLVVAVFTGPDENPWASVPARLLTETGHLPPPKPGWQPGILALGDESRLRALFDDGGLQPAAVESVDMVWTFADSDEYWTFLAEVTALGPAVRALPPAECHSIRTTLDERLAPHAHTDGFVIPARCWGVLAVN